MPEVDYGFTCHWRIDKFNMNMMQLDGCSFQSQRFQVPMLNNSTWYLELNFLRYAPLELALCRDGNVRTSNLEIKFAVLTTSGWKHITEEVRFKACGNGQKVTILEWNSRNNLWNGCLRVMVKMLDSSMENYYGHCVMTSLMNPHNCRMENLEMVNLTCSRSKDLLNLSAPFISQINPVVYRNNIKQTKSEGTQTENFEVQNTFNDSEDLFQQFKENKFSYVILQTATKDFAVHKALLCARSPVFNAMFQSKLIENTSSVVDIVDIDSGTLSLMVQFLHMETIGDPDWDASVNLYYAADKYQVDLLKNECKSLIKKKLTDRNVCETFILADAHNDKELQNGAQEYFVKNSKTILLSDEWTHLLFKRTDLASKLLCTLAKHL